MVNYIGNESDQQAVSLKLPAVFYGEVLKMMTGGSQKEAIGALEMFLAIWPDVALAHNDLGVLYSKEGEKEKALEHYEHAVRLEPETATFQKNLADFYYVEAGRVEEAMGLYVKVLGIDPTDIEVLLSLGSICVSLEKFKDAKFFYERVLEIEPWNVNARERLDELGGGQTEDGGRRTEVRGQKSEVGGETDGWMNGGLDGRDKDGSQRSEIGGRESKDGGQRSEVRIKIIKNSENLGFAAGNNQGMAAARGNYILLMNNDIVVTPGWLERMISCAEKNPRIGIVGPMSNYVSGPQLVEDVRYNTTDLDGLDDYAAEFSKKYAKKTRRLLRVVGFCMLIKRAVVNKIGGMDDRYGLGNFEDDDFSLRATLAGFESWIAEDCFIHHFGNRTFIGAKIDYQESLHKNWEIFKKKWDFPGDMPYGSYDVSQILKKGFIPEKHYRPLLNTPDSMVCEAANITGSGDSIESEMVFKKKEKTSMVSIIIPVAGQHKQLKKCVEHIGKNTLGAHELIFVDNGCKSAMLKWIRQAVKRESSYRLIKAGKKAGLGKCFNVGMEISSGEYIILLPDHPIVADGWLDGMLRCINSEDNPGIVGPMTHSKAAGIQYVVDSGHVDIDHLEKYAEIFLQRNQHRSVPVRDVADFCMLFRRNLAERIGPFDEELEQGSESADYCFRATLEGYKNFIAGDVFVLCGDLPLQGNKRSFKHKWRSIDARSYQGEKVAALNAIDVAENLYHREEVDKAVVAIIDGIKYSPDEKAIYHRLAEMLIDCKRFKEGLEAINSIPGDKERDAKTVELTGYCKEGMELYDEADRYADRALSLNPSSAPALNLKGMLAYKKGDKTGSEGFFNRAISSDPGYGDAYTNLGVLSWEAGRKEDALELLEKGCMLSPTIADNITTYHSVVSEMSEFESAENLFRETKTLYPQNRRVAFLLIDVLIRQEKYDSAIREIREAMITFGLSDGILSASQAVLAMLDAQEAEEDKKKPALSLCMIVKDEENWLVKCLMSIMPIVDEIIVVDTGSTDRTREIAKVFGAKVYDFEWNDDFSEARNFSLSKASGDWILVLDADEVLSPLDYKRLTRIVKSDTDHPVGYSIVTRNYVKPPYITGWTCNDGYYPEEEDGTGWHPSSKVRLFSNDNRIRFQNPVHEFVENSLMKYGIEIRKCDIPIHHYGQVSRENYDAKSDKYYRLSKKKFEEKGGDLESLIKLAIQAGSEFGKYEEAVDLWERVLKIDPRNTKALVNMGGVLLRLKRYEAARTSSKTAMEQNPGLKEAIIIYTTSEVFIGNTGIVIPILEDLLKEAPEYPMAIALLASVYGIEGKKEKGVEHIKRLMKIGFACDYYLHDLSKKLILTGKTGNAVSLLELAVESGNGTKEIRELLDSLLMG